MLTACWICVGPSTLKDSGCAAAFVVFEVPVALDLCSEMLFTAECLMWFLQALAVLTVTKWSVFETVVVTTCVIVLFGCFEPHFCLAHTSGWLVIALSHLVLC